MNYITQLMNAEREFSGLANVKKARSKDKSLNLFYRNKNLYEYYKVRKERDSYRREIEEMADEQFPIHLEIDIHELLHTSAL
jgi:hypothetical protein